MLFRSATISSIRTLPAASSLFSCARPMRISFACRKARMRWSSVLRGLECSSCLSRADSRRPLRATRAPASARDVQTRLDRGAYLIDALGDDALEPELANSLEEGFPIREYFWRHPRRSLEPQRLESPSTNAERLTRQILAVFPEQVEQHELYGVIEDRSEACRARRA